MSTGFGIVVVAARREAESRRADVPWHLRESRIDVAAALTRYVVSTYGNDELWHLSRAVVECSWQAECARHGSGTLAQLNGVPGRQAFHEAARGLVRYAVGRGWLDAVTPDMVGVERLTILAATEPHNSPVLKSVMMQDLGGAPLGMVNIYTASRPSGDRQT